MNIVEPFKIGLFKDILTKMDVDKRVFSCCLLAIQFDFFVAGATIQG